MIDIHSHVLPNIDDGSKSIEMTLEMLRLAEKDGTKEIVATPHFCRGYGDVTFEEVKELVRKVRLLSKKEGIDINISYGQEVYYCNSMIDDYKSGITGTINDSKYMLFELPMMEDLDKEVFDILYEFKVMGVTPILAHPERYKFMVNNPIMINKFIDEEILFQMNSGSIRGKFGGKVKKTSEIFIEKGIYNFIGSDAHNNLNRCTGISKAMELVEDKNKIYTSLFNESAVNMLKNEEVKFIGHRINKKKSFFSFFR